MAQGYVRVWSGSLSYIGTINRINALGTILLTVHAGTLDKVNRVGTQKWLGTVNRVNRIGTINYINRIGTVGHIGSGPWIGSVGRVMYVAKMGTVGRIGTAHTGTVPVELARRQFIGTVMRDRVRLGPGSVWVGSWLHIGSYKTKTVKFDVGNPGTSGGGSIALIMGLTGTTQSRMTGTYYGPVRIGKGSLTVISWAEAMRYVRPWVRQHAREGSYWAGGTVSFGISLHV